MPKLNLICKFFNSLPYDKYIKECLYTFDRNYWLSRRFPMGEKYFLGL